MKKIFQLLVLVIFTQTINSQVINIKARSIRDVYQIVNQENNKSSVFFIENKKISSYLLGDNFEILDTISFDKPEKKFNSIAGHTYSENSYTIIWRTNDKNEFYTQEIDFNTNKIIGKSFSSEPLEKETLTPIQEKDRLIFLRIKKESNIIKIISFDKKNNFENKSIDLSSINFIDSKNDSAKFKDILFEKTGRVMEC